MISNDENEQQQEFVDRVVMHIALIVSAAFIILGIAIANQMDALRVQDQKISNLQATQKLMLERLEQAK